MKLTLASKAVEDQSADDVLQLAAELDLHGVEFYGLPDHLPVNAKAGYVRELAQTARRLGLAVTVLDTYLGQFSQNGDEHAQEQLRLLDRYLEMAEVLECPWIRLWPGEPLHPRDAREDHFLRAAHYLAVAADRAAGHDRGVILETHPGINATTESMLHVLQLVDRPNVRVTYDSCNQLFSRDPDYGPSGFERLLPYVVNVHVKNGDPSRPRHDDFHDVLFEDGKLDWVQLFRAIQRSGYDGWVAIESHKRPTAEMDTLGIVRHEAAAVRAAWDMARKCSGGLS